MEKRSVHTVNHNSDLNEGRGHNVVMAIVSNYPVAKELAKGIDVMGTDGEVRSEELWYHEGKYYRQVPVFEGSLEEFRTEEVLKKAKKYLTDKEIAIIQNSQSFKNS